MTDHAASLPKPDYEAAYLAEAVTEDLGVAVRAACKPLYDRIAELETERARAVKRRWKPSERQLLERCVIAEQREFRFRAALEDIRTYVQAEQNYLITRTGQKSQAFSDLLGRVGAALRGDTE